MRQPNIAAIDSGRTIPRPETLERLLHAARIRPSLVLERHRERVIDLVHRHRGHDPRVFGSISRGTDSPDSDIDLLVTFDEEASLLDVSGLVLELEQLLGVRVDVVDDGPSEVAGRARATGVPV